MLDIIGHEEKIKATFSIYRWGHLLLSAIGLNQDYLHWFPWCLSRFTPDEKIQHLPFWQWGGDDEPMKFHWMRPLPRESNQQLCHCYGNLTHLTVALPSSARCWLLLLLLSLDSKQLWLLTLYISRRSFAKWLIGSWSFIILKVLQMLVEVLSDGKAFGYCIVLDSLSVHLFALLVTYSAPEE